MTATLRKELLLEKIRESTSISVTELSKSFPVTPATIRRDLTELEQQGLVERSHGEVHCVQPSDPVSPFLLRNSVHKEEKQKIAQKAFSMLKKGMSVLLDSGSSTLALAELISRDPFVTVVTNSLTISNALVFTQVRMVCCGGLLENRLACFVGPDAEQYFERIEVDILFLGASGVRGSSGLTCTSPLQYSLKQKMMAASAKKYALIDSSKFENSNLYEFAPFEELDGIITDRPEEGSPAAAALEELGRKGVSIILA